MRRGRIFLFLGLIIILGLAAVFFVYQRFMSTPTPAAAGGDPAVQATQVVEQVNVVVVAQQVPRGQLLDDQFLSEVPIALDLYQEGNMYTDVQEVIGRQARFDLEPGLPLTNGMLVDSSAQLSPTGSLAALSIPRGMVAVSIPINRLSSVSYAPQSGDHVNVIASMLLTDLDTDFQTLLPNQSIGVIAPGEGQFKGDIGGEVAQSGAEDSVAGQSGSAGLEVASSSIVAVGGGGRVPIGRAELDPLLGQTFYVIPSELVRRPRLVTQALLQDAIVLRMGDFPLEDQSTTQQPTQGAADEQVVMDTAQDAPPTDDPNATVNKPAVPDVVTLIVSPQDAVTLNYLVYSGAQLTLALRYPDDRDRYPIEAVTLQFLLDQYGIPVPVKLPYGTEPRLNTNEIKLPPSLMDITTTPTPQP